MNEEARELERLVWAQAGARARQGDLAYVGELGSRLATGHEAALEDARTHERGLAHVLRVLALTPGRDSLEQLIPLLDEHGPYGRSETGPRFVAALLAQAQRPADLAELLYDGQGLKRKRLDELRACLFHELLLRGVDARELRPVAFWLAFRGGWHRLSWLPAERRPLEAGSTFPSWSIGGSAHGVPMGLPAEGRMDPPTPRTAAPSSLRNVATAEVHENIVAAPHTGRFCCYDGWVFEPDEPLEPALVPALLPVLPMDCVAGLSPTGRFEVARRAPADIWPMLFGTASMGGFTGRGAQGAWGRRAAWSSMAGLCGAPPGASAEEVERLALKSVWFHFECDTEWFYDDGEGYGLAVLSPDHRRLAVLTATDTD
ncbi:DUF6183 family protein [Streptomyces sp. NPDC048603]|uniref:DUF6183 family protein n=1 Tax=Streptomyces sp. NPDC048603 TaxID=3365577 RepID=UPI003715F678